MTERKRYTAAKGGLEKVNLEGCRTCGKVYVSPNNANKLQVVEGWHLLANLEQNAPGHKGLNVVIRVRGRVWGKKLGQRMCPDCKSSGVK